MRTTIFLKFIFFDFSDCFSILIKLYFIKEIKKDNIIIFFFKLHSFLFYIILDLWCIIGFTKNRLFFFLFFSVSVSKTAPIFFHTCLSKAPDFFYMVLYTYNFSRLSTVFLTIHWLLITELPWLQAEKIRLIL